MQFIEILMHFSQTKCIIVGNSSFNTVDGLEGAKTKEHTLVVRENDTHFLIFHRSSIDHDKRNNC